MSWPLFVSSFFANFDSPQRPVNAQSVRRLTGVTNLGAFCKVIGPKLPFD